jgi:hypothetical protein
MSGFGGFIMGAGVVIFVAAMLSGGEPEAKAVDGKPKVVTVTKVVEKKIPFDRAGRCMSLQEKGEVQAVAAYEGDRNSSLVTFKMSNGFTRVCEFKGTDYRSNLKEGMVLVTRGGERIL